MLPVFRASIGALVGVLTASAAAAQTQTQTQTAIVVLARTATNRGAYHYLEAFAERGRWIPLDIGYIDFNHPKDYREIFFGAGGQLYHNERLTIVEEGLITKTAGALSGGDVYFNPWTFATYRVTEKVGAEVVYFPYLPLTRSGRVQHLLERAKVEYDFTRVKVGGGYSAYQSGDDPWHHKPFITTTFKGGAFGSVELWLQRLPGNDVTVQIRYANSFR